MTALALAFAGGRLAAHDPVSPTGGGPGTNAVIVDVGPAPGHALRVSNSGDGAEGQAVDRAGLVQAVSERMARSDDVRPWVRGHRDATYEAVLKVMGRLTAAGMRVSVFVEREIWEWAHERAKREDER